MGSDGIADIPLTDMGRQTSREVNVSGVLSPTARKEERLIASYDDR